jgi:Zn-finger nucleic acid-binding protein
MADAWDERKKGQEEEYFRRKEQEALEKVRQRVAAEEQITPREKAALRCPKCEGNLEEITFQNVLIDRCSACHGVWLDAGELERLTTKEGQGWFSHFWRSFGN